MEMHDCCWPYLFRGQICFNTQMLTIGFQWLVALSVVTCCTMLSLRATGLSPCLSVAIVICVTTCCDVYMMMTLPNSAFLSERALATKPCMTAHMHLQSS